MGVSLKGLGTHTWGKGRKGKDIWDRKNLIHGRKGGFVPSVLEERAGGKQHRPVGLGGTGEPGLIN